MKLIHLKENVELSDEDIEEYRYLIGRIAHVKQNLLDINNQIILNAVKEYQPTEYAFMKNKNELVEFYLGGYDGAFPKSGIFHKYFAFPSREYAQDDQFEEFYQGIMRIIQDKMKGEQITIKGFKAYTAADDDRLQIDTQPASIIQYLFITKKDKHLVNEYNKLYNTIVAFFKQHQL